MNVDSSLNCLKFNPFKSNLLALCGKHVHLANISESGDIKTFKPGDVNPHSNSNIISVSWNNCIQHILATGSTNGIVTVWDLKNNKPSFTFDSQKISN